MAAIARIGVEMGFRHRFFLSPPHVAGDTGSLGMKGRQPGGLCVKWGLKGRGTAGLCRGPGMASWARSMSPQPIDWISAMSSIPKLLPLTQSHQPLLLSCPSFPLPTSPICLPHVHAPPPLPPLSSPSPTTRSLPVRLFAFYGLFNPQKINTGRYPSFFIQVCPDQPQSFHEYNDQ